MVNAICLLQDIKTLLTILVDKVESRTNIHSIYTFDTAGTERITKDVIQLLGLPKGYSANVMTIFDKGGGFTFKINGQDPVITATGGMAVTHEDINTIEFTSGGAAGTAKVRFGAYINKV